MKYTYVAMSIAGMGVTAVVNLQSAILEYERD